MVFFQKGFSVKENVNLISEFRYRMVEKPATMCQHVFTYLQKLLFPIFLSFQHKPTTYSKLNQFYSNKAASREWLKVHVYKIDLLLKETELILLDIYKQKV